MLRFRALAEGINLTGADNGVEQLQQLQFIAGQLNNQFDQGWALHSLEVLGRDKIMVLAIFAKEDERIV